MSVRRVYFNTSVLIKAVSLGEEGSSDALAFIVKLVDRGFVPVISNVHLEERFRPETSNKISSLIQTFGFRICRVGLERVRREAENYVVSRGVSPSHLVDVMHLVAARECGCRFIAAVDRFIWAHAREFGLKYINYYTGIP